MAIISLSITNEMKGDLLNGLKNGDVYLVVEGGGTIIGSKKITFGNATATTGGMKIEWIPSGTSGNNGSDFEIPLNTRITSVSLVDDITEAPDQQNLLATVQVAETFTYGGIVRIDKITITLT